MHIGTGEKLLRDFDFIVRDEEVGFLDLEKVVELIGKERIPQLTAEIERKTVGSFLENALPNIPLRDICKYTVKIKGHITRTTSELKAQFRTALHGPCIPGSSLKGSMRTAMLGYLTDHTQLNEEKQKELLKQIRWNNTPRVSFGPLDNQLFGSTANSKSTRFLTVSDIQFKPSDTETHELSYINQLGNGDWEYEISKLQLVECLRIGATATFQLKLNLDLAETYKTKQQELINKRLDHRSMPPLKDLSFFGKNECALLANLNRYTMNILQWDVDRLKFLDAEPDLIDSMSDILQKVCAVKEGEAILRVGAHNGWHFMTGRWMMYQEKVFTDSMFDAMQVAAQRTDKYLGCQFPKTRKMTDAGLPLGFVKIKLL